MPAHPAVPGLMRFRTLHTIGSDTNTGWHIYFQAVGSPTTAQLQAAVDAGHAAWGANLGAYSHSSVTLTQIEGTDLGSASSIVATNTVPIAGTRVGTELPASACALVVWRIHRRYRGGKPRAYIPAGVSGDLATPQTWTGAFSNGFLTAYVNYATAIFNSIKTWDPNAQQVNVSYYAGHQWLPDQNGNYHRVPTPRAVPLIDVVYANVIAGTVGQQRRRLRPG